MFCRGSCWLGFCGGEGCFLPGDGSVFWGLSSGLHALVGRFGWEGWMFDGLEVY